MSTRHRLIACNLQVSGIHFMYSARILGYSSSGGCTVSWQNLYTAPNTAMSPACRHQSSSLDLESHEAFRATVQGRSTSKGSSSLPHFYTIPVLHTLLDDLKCPPKARRSCHNCRNDEIHTGLPRCRPHLVLQQPGGRLRAAVTPLCASVRA